MNKPEILKGEVKEFIDWMDFRLMTLGDCIDAHKIRDFYSQPFKSEMIQYFDFWKANYWDRIKFDFDEDNKFTLSQLITNAIQAGIKLTWKE